MNEYDYTGSARFSWSLALVLMLVLASYGAGLPDLTRPGGQAVGATAASLVAAAAGLSALQLFMGDALLPRFVLLVSVLLLFPWYLLCAWLATAGRTRQEMRDRVFFVGTAEDNEVLRRDLALGAEVAAALVGSHEVANALPSPEEPAPLCSAVTSARATVLVLSREAQADEEIVHQAAQLHEGGMRVRTLSLFYEQWLGKLPLPELERVSLLYDISELHRAVYGRASRIVDLALASVGMAALAVAIPVVALGNLVANHGPLFYRQARVGKNGVPFSILKFRTMRPAAHGLPNEWTVEDDPRITPFGRVLRRTHVDELPQVVNILRGDLSLVGPRPEQPHYVAELTAKLPFYGLRHLVTPGLTGWAQVKYGYAGNESDALEKLQYEFYYLRHQSISLDVKIIMRTVRRVVRATGR